jgi:hypothetical protein
MNAKSQVVGQIKGTSGLTRPRFGPGQLLRDDDLTQGVAYTRDLSRLLFKSLLGCGVMCGLVVDWSYSCNKLNVVVGAGVALDCDGDPVWVQSPQTIVIDFDCTGSDVPDYVWVVLRGYEKCCAPRAAQCGCDDEDPAPQCTREVEAFEIRVLGERPKCVCGCPEPDGDETHLLDSRCRCVNPDPQWCYGKHYDGSCGCNCGDCEDCECDWILLARLKYNGDSEHPAWTVDHRVRRFIRPVLMRDPRVEAEYQARQAARATAEPAPAPAASAPVATKQTARKTTSRGS